jgi:enamine deaminase RidA (YjgF/YER057c/UK114 family)
MSSKTAVLTDKAPKPLPGIYSQAIVANGTVYCSGAVPMDAETGKIIDGDIQAHTVSIYVSFLYEKHAANAKANDETSINASRT